MSSIVFLKYDIASLVKARGLTNEWMHFDVVTIKAGSPGRVLFVSNTDRCRTPLGGFVFNVLILPDVVDLLDYT